MSTAKLPEWVSCISLTKAVHSISDDEDKVMAVIPIVDSIQYRNCTILMPIKVKVQQKDMTTKKLSFVLKAQNSSKFQAKIMSQFKMFFREDQMYHQILPKFEEIYSAAGKTVQFGPRAFKLDYNIGANYILLEDLKAKGFKNADRQGGFDQLHIKEVLKKLAGFHAVSAVYVEKYGMFSKLFTLGVYTKGNKPILKELNDADPFLTQLRRWRVGTQFHKRLIDKEKVLIDRILDNQTVNPHEFNVLNHSDCWVNNVMFKNDGFGNIEDIQLLDYQVVKYGSPAYDLFYTILSSANRDIKLEKFDYLVQYYFYYLLENLKFLKFRRPMPEFAKIQEALNNNGIAAYVVVSRVLPIVMMHGEFEDENSDRYASKMKCSMFTNRKYIQVMNEVLPWMDARGLLNWS
ncbi:uncharacterized protein LOC115624107 [Scaptodrosophila lebanonensis]|uniref:Uncharacterized protein LOC115624107 n=1 Tax=Drosophila lebanonensis TaxID=7225 RepID=A0A6J2TGI9_DROLE|nr:uncharacterized protein LOC115624107 [Scaptodrosophila lebanonensis]